MPHPESSHRIALTGLGCVSPLGIGLTETSAGLREGRDGVRPVTMFPVDRYQSKTAGQVPLELAEKARAIHGPARHWSRAAQMLLVAMEEAVRFPAFAPDFVVMATTSGGMIFGEQFYRAIASGRPGWKESRRVRNYVPHQPVLDAMAALKIRAPIRVVSNACASGTNAIGLGTQLIRSGAARKVLVGGYDALAELVFAGFDCLKASTAEKCRPFDAARTGLVLGEGAAVFCLEQDGASDLHLTGYGSATDIHHLTQPHPSGLGPRQSMQAALRAAGAEPDSLDYVNAHGTGTPLNDSSEARAILDVCPRARVSSTKGMTGHALGAAGAIEAAFCSLALREGFVPPNLNYTSGDPELPLQIAAQPNQSARLRRVISNSFGFGGSNASLILEATS